MKNILFLVILLLISFSFQNVLNSQIKVKGYVKDMSGCVLTDYDIEAVYLKNSGFFSKVFNKIPVKKQSDSTFLLQIKEPAEINFIIEIAGQEDFGYYFNVQNDTLIDIYVMINPNNDDIVRKPIIYLYPTQETKINIKLNFNGEITNTYPEYNDGWQIFAKPNGDLINLEDGSKHRYLFWDGINSEQMQISDFQTGFVVPADETSRFLDSTLTKIGLNDYEKNDFITFWLPLMKQNKYNFVHFLINENCNDIATLELNPKPDSEIRIYMFFAGIDESFSIKPQTLETIDRRGFVLVEWGGVEMNSQYFSNK